LRTLKLATSVRGLATSSAANKGTHPYDDLWPFTQWGLDIMSPFPVAI